MLLADCWEVTPVAIDPLGPLISGYMSLISVMVLEL